MCTASQDLVHTHTEKGRSASNNMVKQCTEFIKWGANVQSNEEERAEEKENL